MDTKLLTATVEGISVPYSEAAFLKLRAHAIASEHLGFRGRHYDQVIFEVKKLARCLVEAQELTDPQVQAIATWHEQRSDHFFDLGLHDKAAEELDTDSAIDSQSMAFVLSTYHGEMWEAYLELQENRAAADPWKPEAFE